MVQEPLIEQNLTEQNLTEWSLQGVRVERVHIVRVVDGDTFCLALPVCCTQRVFRCRLRGVDTPEIRTRDMEEKERGRRAVAFVEELVSRNVFDVECHGFDKYGRVLCDLFLHGTRHSLAEMLLEEGHAVKIEKKSRHSNRTSTFQS